MATWRPGVPYDSLPTLPLRETSRPGDRLPKIYSRELVDVLFEQPYVRIKDVVEAGIVGRQAASRYLKSLVSIGLLEERRAGREVLFVHRGLLDVLADEEHARHGPRRQE